MQENLEENWFREKIETEKKSDPKNWIHLASLLFNWTFFCNKYQLSQCIQQWQWKGFACNNKK